MGTQSVMQFVDRVILSWSSAEAVAAAMPAGSLILTLVFLPQGIAGYSSTFIAHSNGARQFRNIGIYLWQGVWIALIGGLLLLLPALFSRPLFSLFPFTPEVRAMGVDYFRILCCGQLPSLLSVALSGFYSGRGKTWFVAIVMGSGALLNGILDYILVLGTRWNPAYGIAGAAWATVIASTFTTVLFALGVFQKKYEGPFGVRSLWRWNSKALRRLFKFGFPPGIQLVVDLGCFSWLLITIGSLGTEVLAASNLVFQVEMLGLLPLVGIGIAGAIAVGKYQGAARSDRAVRSVRSVFWISIAYSTLMGVLLLLFPNLFLIPFRIGADPVAFEKIFELAISLFPFVVIYIFGDALINVFAGALKGAGDTAFVMWVVVFGSIPGLGVIPLLIVKVFGGSIYLLWIWIVTYIAILSAIFILRFKRGQWKKIVLLDPIDQEEEEF